MGSIPKVDMNIINRLFLRNTMDWLLNLWTEFIEVDTKILAKHFLIQRGFTVYCILFPCIVCIVVYWTSLQNYNAALQMKGRWESMSCSHFCIPRNETVCCIISKTDVCMFCLPLPTIIYCICERLIFFPGSVFSQICWPILGIYKSLTDTWM